MPNAIDHIVVAVSSLETAVPFYRDVAGLELIDAAGEVATFRCGDQLLKLETPERVGALVAARIVPGSSDLCLEVDAPVQETLARLDKMGINPVAGPVERVGARGPMASVYLRDPDGSLVELCHYRSRP